MGCWVLRLIGRESRAGADADFRFEYFSRYGSDGRTRPAAADADLLGDSGNVLVVDNVGGVVVPLLSVLYEYPLFLVISRIPEEAVWMLGQEVYHNWNQTDIVMKDKNIPLFAELPSRTGRW
jgi:hypothetical protein